MEKLKNWLKILFNQKVEDSQESGIACSYDGGYYSFLHAIRLLVQSDTEEFIMYTKGSDYFITYTNLNYVGLEIGKAKGFALQEVSVDLDKSGNFRHYPRSIKVYKPTEFDLHENWIVVSRKDFNDGSIPEGMLALFNGPGFTEEKQKEWFDTHYRPNKAIGFKACGSVLGVENSGKAFYYSVQKRDN